MVAAVALIIISFLSNCDTHTLSPSDDKELCFYMFMSCVEFSVEISLGEIQTTDLYVKQRTKTRSASFMERL